MRMPVLVRLSLRWQTLTRAPAWFVATLFYCTLVAALHAAVARAWGRTFPLDPSQLVGLWGGGLAAGAVLAWTLQDLWFCPASASTPGLRRAVQAESLVVLVSTAAGIAGLLAWAEHKSGRVEPAHLAVVFAISLLAGGIGVFVANPTRFCSGWSRPGLAFGLLGSAYLVDPLAQGLTAWPWIGVPIVAALGVAILLRALSAAEHRRMLSAANGSSFRPRADPMALEVAIPSPTVASRWAPAWKGARSWVRATLHEVHGAGTGGWAGHIAGQVAILVVVAVLPLVRDPMRGELLETETTWRLVVAMWSIALGIWTASAPLLPRVAFVRATSRRERALTAWRVHGIRTGWLLGASLAILLAIGAEDLARLVAAGRTPHAVHGLPDVLGALLALGIVAPWGAWARLWMLDRHSVRGHSPGGMWRALFATVVVVAFVATTQFLGSGWFALEDAHAALAASAAVLLLAGSWWAYRALLARHFRHADLEA